MATKKGAALALVTIGGVAVGALLFVKPAKAAEAERIMPPSPVPSPEELEQMTDEEAQLMRLYLLGLYYNEFYTAGELVALKDILASNGLVIESENLDAVIKGKYGDQPIQEGPGRFGKYLETGKSDDLPSISQEVWDLLEQELERLTREPQEPPEPPPPPTPPEPPEEPPTPPEGPPGEPPAGLGDIEERSPGIWPGYPGEPLESWYPSETDNPYLPPGGLPPIELWPMPPSPPPIDLSKLPYPED